MQDNPHRQGPEVVAEKSSWMRGKRRPPVLATLPEQGPGPISDGDRGVSLRREGWQAYEELLASVASLGDPNVVLITGADERIRAEVATGLGTAGAVHGRRTLVMECDLAHPVLAEIVGLDRGPGLREYLCWAASAPELLQPVSLVGLATKDRTSLGQLVFITAGRAAANAGGLLAGEGFSGALAKVSKAYDLVILSGGPLLGPETDVIAQSANALLVCIGPDMATRQGFSAIVTALEGLPELPAGLVVHQRS